ncbi:hypothetical protein MPTK1_7g14710 [Marchantia polymorpha subsp. ruderalis]|uniref:Uncharacterized protein n=2 Tax=Marchantia polymorpha TaxID=3197 RepID=A0AAF6BZM8_MARPO|nr:hypothetical protein MARPO_0009s0156 [Marchantia polymorpha]BBN17462.1 hypothetical protein Mp_7g14710 [Marchantia polymorpha subsp. ruderalis]|eukprot:PTQ47068.1 hypothetical protein MARPO_0009s0156 [Marchantia polymorpha]
MEATEALDPSMKASTHSQHVALGRLRALKCKTKRLSSILMSADVVVPDWARRSPWDGVYTTKAVAMARSSDSARDIGGEAGSGSSSDAQDEDGFRDEGALTSADAGVRSSSIEKSDGRLRRKKACGRKKIRMSNSRFRRDDCLLELTKGHYKGPYNGDDDKNASSSGTKPKPRRSVNLARVLTLDKPANESEDDFEYLSTVIKETSCTKMQLLSRTIDSHEESSPELSPQCTLGMQEDSGSTGRVEAAAFQNDENEVSRGKGKKDSSEVQDKEGRVVVSGHVGSFDLNATPSSSDVEKEEDGKQIFDFDLTVKDPSSNIHDIEEKKYRGHEKLLSCDDIEGKNETCARQRGVDCKGGEAVIGSNERHCTMRYFKRRKNFKKNGGDNTKPLVAMDNEYVKKTSPSATGMLGTDEVERTMKYFRRKNFKKKSCENYKPHLAIEDEEAKKTSTSVNEKVQIGYSETLNSDSSDYLPISYMRRKGKKVLERTDQDSTDTWEPDLQQFSNATDKFLPNSSARNQTALGWTENMGSGTSGEIFLCPRSKRQSWIFLYGHNIRNVDLNLIF